MRSVDRRVGSGVEGCAAAREVSVSEREKTVPLRQCLKNWRLSDFMEDGDEEEDRERPSFDIGRSGVGDGP